MFTINTLMDFVKELRGLVAEPLRVEIAHRVADLISNAIQNTNEETYRQWIFQDRIKFLRHCELVNIDRWVDDSMYIHPTKLSEFCNKWMDVNMFKLHNDPSAEWRPITPEQNSLRVTMIEDLKTLSLDKPVE
jgi:ethanolamine utilization protein EutA (predicted chaperonin)